MKIKFDQNQYFVFVFKKKNINLNPDNSFFLNDIKVLEI